MECLCVADFFALSIIPTVLIQSGYTSEFPAFEAEYALVDMYVLRLWVYIHASLEPCFPFLTHLCR